MVILYQQSRVLQGTKPRDIRYCELYMEICRECWVHIIIIDGDSCNNFKTLSSPDVHVFVR